MFSSTVSFKIKDGSSLQSLRPASASHRNEKQPWSQTCRELYPPLICTSTKMVDLFSPFLPDDKEATKDDDINLNMQTTSSYIHLGRCSF